MRKLPPVPHRLLTTKELAAWMGVHRLVDDVRTWFLTTTEYFKVPTLHDTIQPPDPSVA